MAEGSIQSSTIGPDMRYDFYAGEMELIDPLPLDNKLTEICRRFTGSDATTRAITRTSVSMEDFYTLFTFARRSAVFALRDNQSSHIIDGLTAIAVIELKRVDDVARLVVAQGKHGRPPRKSEQGVEVLYTD